MTMSITKINPGYPREHGSPHDRGGADSYYGRSYAPHYWPDGTYTGQVLGKADMTPEQLEEYRKGYNENELAGNFKDWGV